MLLISMPSSAITVSQMHIPPKTHFQKAVGGVSKFVCGQSSFVLNSSAYMNWEKKHFYLIDNRVLILICFLKPMLVELDYQESDYQSVRLHPFYRQWVDSN